MSSRRNKPAARKAARRPQRQAAAKAASRSAPRRAARPAAKASSKPVHRKAANAAPKPAPKSARAPPAQRVRLDQPVADFTAASTGGHPWRLQDARGRKLVLYFYPRDNTPGCTLEGQQFASLAPQFAAAGITVLGISRDSIGSHEKFRAQMCFPFDLLSDGGEAICRQFDVIREKHMYGRKVLGIERSTFLLDAAGVLKREWRGVKVDGHAQQVLMAAQAL
jgi:thioredoxin-dependent peroxiredoxin